jgi:5-formyltetrahydrofolate cyclo-ligase
MSFTKSILRRSILSTRQALPPPEWQAKSQQICNHLTQFSSFQQAQTVLAYFPIRQEPDLTPVFKLPKIWGFPCCVGQSLVWHQWSAGDPLETDAYGIAVPLATSSPITISAVDLILVPAVACDRQGYRLGYGGGFYDRLFQDPQWQSKPAIAICFAFSLLEALPHDPWDQLLSGVCTEEGLWMFNPPPNPGSTVADRSDRIEGADH